MEAPTKYSLRIFEPLLRSLVQDPLQEHQRHVKGTVHFSGFQGLHVGARLCTISEALTALTTPGAMSDLLDNDFMKPLFRRYCEPKSDYNHIM